MLLLCLILPISACYVNPSSARKQDFFCLFLVYTLDRQMINSLSNVYQGGFDMEKEEKRKNERMQVNFRLSPDELADLDRRAAKYHVTRSEYVKRCALGGSPDDRVGRAALRAVLAAESSRTRATIAAISSCIAAACSVAGLVLSFF